MSTPDAADGTSLETGMRGKRFLVVGATGHVGSKITGRLAERGYDVTALVRRPGATIEDPYNGIIRYAVGDLAKHAKVSAYWAAASQEPVHARVIAEQMAAVPK